MCFPPCFHRDAQAATDLAGFVQAIGATDYGKATRLRPASGLVPETHANGVFLLHATTFGRTGPEEEPLCVL